MRYYLDTEFIHAFRKPLFGRRRHYIDLVQIALVAEDGRTYEAISSEYNYKDSDDWLKENVLMPLYRKHVSGDMRNIMQPHNFHRYLGKPNRQIAREIFKFVNPCLARPAAEFGPGLDCTDAEHNATVVDGLMVAQPEFWAYYADYDWVLLCSLFGRMPDLPKGFPMHCLDLKQEADRLGFDTATVPQPADAHDALADARWNQRLHAALQAYERRSISNPTAP